MKLLNFVDSVGAGRPLDPPRMDRVTQMSREPDARVAIDKLNQCVAIEIVCVLRYTYHAAVAAGLGRESSRTGFQAHAAQEMQHVDWLSERIIQLGGQPNLMPVGPAARSALQLIEGDRLIEMMRENLVAERVSAAIYRDLVTYFSGRDHTSQLLMERILAQEEEHARDMRDLLRLQECP